MKKFDLIIIGAGSGNSVLTPDFDSMDVAIVEPGPFGGTCLNRGCIPSKMFIYPASLVEQIKHASRVGVKAERAEYDFKAIQSRIFDRIDPIAQSGEEWRKSLDNITVYNEYGRFVGPKLLQVGQETITADVIVLAAGARSFIPNIEGLSEVRYHTSDTIMRIDDVPKRLGVLGGGFIACELGHVFDAAGSEVSFVVRGPELLRAADHDISKRLTEVFDARFDLHLNQSPSRIFERASQEPHNPNGTEIVLSFDDGEDLVVDELLVATGRVPNSDELNVEACGVEVDDRGYVVVNEFLATNVDGVWALGDICNAAQLKHVANAEQRAVSHNIIHPNDLVSVNYSGYPSAVFTDPQIASVGLSETEAKATGANLKVHIQDYAHTAYGWAMNDEIGFVKLIADADSRLLLGAHIIGHEASLLISPLILGMRFGLSVDEMARGPLHIHPALYEVVEQCLLEL